jgi:hypothetical protein
MTTDNNMTQEVNLRLIGDLIQQAKKLAREYYKYTGRPMGITGEIAEYEATQLMGLHLSPVRTPGFDATVQKDGRPFRYQIKGRCILENTKRGLRLGSIRLVYEWDAVLLVLLDKNYEPTEIFEAQRDEIEKALKAPGSKARNERGALSLSKFKSIAQVVWPETSPKKPFIK